MFFGFIVFLIPSNLLEEYLNIESTYLFKIILGSSVFIFFSVVELRKRKKIIENLETERTKLKKENKKLNKFYKDYISSKTNYNQQSDSKILKRMKSMLYDSGVIKMMKDHDFGSDYDINLIYSLNDYCYKSENDPEFKFIDPELNTLKNKLDYSISKLLQLLGKYGQPLKTNINYSAIPKGWRATKPDLYKKVTNKSNKHADEIFEIYEEIIVLAQEKRINY